MLFTRQRLSLIKQHKDIAQTPFHLRQGYFAERRTQNAERTMMVSGIECETGRYIIYDKLISYIPNLLLITLTLTLNPKPPTLTLTLTLFQFIIYDVTTCFTLYTADHYSAFCILHAAFCILRSAKYPCPFICIRKYLIASLPAECLYRKVA